MHSFVSCLMHCVFSTKERRRLITPDLEARLYPYLGCIARENKMKTLSIGGVEDHIHMLLSIPPTVPSAKAVQLLKRKFGAFQWQEGYGAFSTSKSGVKATMRYIESQKDHHQRRSFKDELIAFLDKNGIRYEAWMLD